MSELAPQDPPDAYAEPREGDDEPDADAVIQQLRDRVTQLERQRVELAVWLHKSYAGWQRAYQLCHLDEPALVRATTLRAAYAMAFRQFSPAERERVTAAIKGHAT